MKRRVIMTAVAVALAAAAAVGYAWSRPAHMVRVGGSGNACACTHRIEP